MQLCVLVPSYRRATDLARCLAAIFAQRRAADQVIVVARKEDTETLEVLGRWRDRPALEIALVERAGQVHALNAGLAHCRGEVVAITDDDAAPKPDWLQRIEAHFAADPKIGGVGGRDWVHENGGITSGEKRLVGRFLWFGRAIGNHHIGAGPAREVDFLKGANCAFRLSAIGRHGFDARLRGAGAQVHNDLAASLVVRRAGWKLIYDPLVAVDHFPAPRFDADARNRFDAGAAADRKYNFILAMTSGLPVWRLMPALLWFHLIGTREDPGFGHVLLMRLRKDRVGLDRYRAVRQSLAAQKYEI